MLPGGEKNRARGAVQAWARALSFSSRTRGKRGRSWARGAAFGLGGLAERGKFGGGRLGKEMLTGGPGLSAGEKRGEGGAGQRLAGPRPRKGALGGFLGQGRKEEGGERITFLFF